MLVVRRTIAAAGFYDSVAALGDSVEVSRVVRALILHARLYPAQAPRIPGTYARVIRSRASGRFPALRLIYRFGEGTLTLLHIEPV
jgi:hypothetical protein